MSNTATVTDIRDRLEQRRLDAEARTLGFPSFDALANAVIADYHAQQDQAEDEEPSLK